MSTYCKLSIQVLTVTMISVFALLDIIQMEQEDILSSPLMLICTDKIGEHTRLQLNRPGKKTD